MSFAERIKGKKGKEKIIMLTAYDCQIARILDEASVDLILVGDSVGMVFQGKANTKSVRMEDMVYHTQAVSSGVQKTPVIGDMPIGTYETEKTAIASARKFLNAGAKGVKIEGNRPNIIRAVIDSGIPIMGHVGLLPQLAESYRVKGKDPAEAKQILKDAQEMDRIGVFSIVLECIPESLAQKITEHVESPTIGIGAGRYCDGQVLVTNDMLGISQGFTPKFLKKYAHLNQTIKEAVEKFTTEVKTGIYPGNKHTYH